MSTPGSSTHSKPSKRDRILPSFKGKELVAEASGALVTTLTILEKSLDGVPVPGLKAAVAGVLEVIKTVDKAKGNAKDIDELRNNINRLFISIIEPTKEAIMSPALEARIDTLTQDLQKIEADYRKMSSKGSVRQFLAVHDHATTISGLHRMLNQAIQTFLIGGAIEIEKQVVAIDARGEVLLEEVQRAGRQAEVTHQVVSDAGKGVEKIVLTQVEQDLLNRLPYVDARFDAGSRSMAPICLKDTRAALLAEIFDWINGPVTEKKIYWLHGLAGTGKSTIAHTVAKRLAAERHLGASFFFSRDVEERRDALRVLPTIAHQLAEFSPEFKKHLVSELEGRKDAGTAALSVQAEKLLANPLKSMGSTSTSISPFTTPVVVVMDALDECENQDLLTVLLKLLSDFMRNLPGTTFKIFITSRPEQHIVDTFGKSSTTQISRPFVLHDIETKIVKADIESFLRHELAIVADKFRLSKSSTAWPSPSELAELVDRAGALFIVASTGIKFIADPFVRQPKHQLRVLLSNERSASLSSYGELDKVYHSVLKASVGDCSDSECHVCVRFRDVVGAIVTVRDPLSATVLQGLLGCDIEYVSSALERLRSVIVIPPEIESSPEPLRVFHLSFPNFLTERCSDPCFVINPVLHHSKLALHCILHLNTFLQRDLCQLPNPLLLNTEITDLEERLRTAVLPHHRYACQQWGFHLQALSKASKAMGSNYDSGSESLNKILAELLKALHIFCEEKLLQWIEVLSLLGRLGIAIPMLKAAEKWLKLTDSSHPMLGLLNDAQRLLLQFFEPIQLSSSQIYHSALAFMPHSQLYETYKHNLDRSVRLISARETSWSPHMRTLLGHTDYVTSVAFSHDSTLIVTGSNDKTVCIWDAVNGSLVKRLEGHTHSVACVAFSHDSTLIVTGSDDETVCIWDAVNGSLVKRLEGHTHYVTCVAFSHDSTLIVTGSGDKTVCIWDAVNGSLVKRLEGHTDCVRSVAFSHDSTLIVSGSDDKTVCIWDAVNGSLVKRLEGHTHYVRSVAFSHDSTLIITHDWFGHCICWNSRFYTITSTSESITSQPDDSTPSYLNIVGQWVLLGADKSSKLCYLPLPSSNIACYKLNKSSFVFGTNTGVVYILDFSQLLLNCLQ